MAFISVPEERFITDVMKTRVTFFRNDPAFSLMNFSVKTPDIDTQFKLPSMNLKRVEKDSRELQRLSGYFWDSPSQKADATLGRLMGFTYRTTYQFELIDMNKGRLNAYTQAVMSKLKSGQFSDAFASLGWPVVTTIPVLDFSSPSDTVGTATDLKIRFRSRRDIEALEVPSMDTELHTYTIAVSFWINYLKEYEIPKINSIITNDFTLDL